jgi:predicted glycoside hydrolase/deacetylase ChbG (UPF0249 family)
MERLLIVNADDFGLCAGVNEGIIEAHARGIVTSTSLMVERPAAADAVQLAAQHPALSVGLHFDGDTLELDERDQAAAAFDAQLERFRELTGGDPTHVDSHHHVHARNDRLGIFAELVAPLGVPLRHDGRISYVGGFWGQSDSGDPVPEQIGRESLLGLVSSEVENGFNELGCHPARLLGDLRSSYLEQREIELETLTSAQLGEAIAALGVTLVSYLDWPSRSRLG